MNDPAVLGSEIIIGSLSAAVGYLACHLFGRRALNAEIRVVKETQERTAAKEAELVEEVERRLKGNGKLDGEKMPILLNSDICPTCGKTVYIVRGPRCFGIEGECPTRIPHYHSRCNPMSGAGGCGVDWLEGTPEMAALQREGRKKS